MDQNRFDVIVVGGGPAGITAATALGRAGFSVLVCEAAVYPGAENWSGAVYFAENLEDPEAFGREAIERAPFERRLTERGFFLYNGHSMVGATMRDADVFRSCYTVLRPVFDRYLAEVSREHGVVLLCETTVQSLIRYRGRVIGVHTERGPAYADVVFLAEGDASHLVTQEGYERVGPDATDATDEHGPHFLQGVKEVVSLPRDVLEERFGLTPEGGAAYEMLLRNGTRGGRTMRLNMGGFLYTNRDSVSLGFVLPIDNLARYFDGDHNLLIEWFKGLPEVARWIEGGEVTSYGAKIIRGGGLREIPRLTDDGLAIGGAASGIGLDFPYPNFTGPATAMGLLFARAVKKIAADNGGPGNGAAQGSIGDSPFTSAALQRAYVEPVKRTHYYRNVERLADWPSYIERTQFFFERELDVVNGAFYLLSRPEMSAPRRWWEVIRLKRRVIGMKRVTAALRDMRENSGALGLGRAALGSIGISTVGRWVLNTVTALLPTRRATMGGDETTGVAAAEAPGGGKFRMIFRVLAGDEPAGRAPWLARWYWKRFGTALAGAFSDVYTNDNEPLDTKLPRALGRLIGQLSVWDLLVGVVVCGFGLVAWIAQFLIEWFQYAVLKKDLSAFREQPVSRLLDENRRRMRLDDEAVEVVTPYEHKLGTIRYREGKHSHIKVLWPDDLTDRGELAQSPLWSVCPAKVYEVHRHPRGMPGVVVNFDNCVKCESCWRATPDVHWSRATQQRLIYETYTPTHRELRDYLFTRPEPVPRLRQLPSYWEAFWSDSSGAAGEAAAASGPDAVPSLVDLDAELRRFSVALQAYSLALGDSPLALEQGERSHLHELLDAATKRFTSARKLWESDVLASVRDALGDAAADLWHDAEARVDDLSRHAANKRYFWSDVIGEQLRDHHVMGVLDLVERLRDGVAAEVDDGVSAGLPSRPAGAWAWAEGWRAVEARRADLDDLRDEIREWCDENLHSRAIRALEEGEPIPGELRSWLASQLAAAADAGRGNGGPADWVDPAHSAVPVPPPYGRRDILIEELAGRDTSLAVLASHHLLACDLLDGAGASGGTDIDEIVAALRGGDKLAAVVHQGSIGNRPVVSGDAVEGAETALGEGPAELHGAAPLVPLAIADWLLVVRDKRGYLVPVDDPGVTLEEVGCIGLIGAGMRRVAFDGCMVPAERVFELPGLEAGAALTEPAAGEPFADLVRVAVGDHLAVIRGAGDYLVERARDHASNRVQFPGTFQDEAGRDTIAKFGAVKQLLAEIEAQRILVESLSIIDPGPAEDRWIGAAVRKVLAADAFGPKEGSYAYNTGQVFGGTAFSEDDNIAKYYRDSSPFRFMLAHDDALRVEIGRRRLAAVRDGGSLIPVAEGEAAWLQAVSDEGPLADVAPRWEAACAELETWAAGLAGGYVDPAIAELVNHQAGDAVARALGVKVCILRTAWRIEAGAASQATLEATRLLNDRFVAGVPSHVADADLLPDTVAVGADSTAHGDFEPGPEIASAETYREVLATDHEADSGEWLVRPFDAEHLRYVPEIMWNDPELRSFRESLEEEIKGRYVERTFDGLPYGRYLEKLHIVPQEDIDYLIDRGFLRMPIPAEFGGEDTLKALYYIMCEMTGRYGDAALSLAIMANTSIGTTPMLLGLKQDLPRARDELEKVKADPSILGEIREGLDGLIAGLTRPDVAALQKEFLALTELVKSRILKSSVLKYIGSGFLRAFFAAGQAGEQRDLDGFGEHLREARERIDEILGGVQERLAEHPRRERAHHLFLKLISAGYVSAFALTEPTAGSDSGGVKTTGRLNRRRVFEDDDGVLWFWLDEKNEEERRYLLDADKLEFDFDAHRILYRWADDADPAVIEHDEYDYERDLPGHWRYYMHGDRKVEFTDIAQIRDDEGERVYEFWELSGTKMWITNGRFAQCFALYANTEPEGVTGFMVDRHAEGLVVGSDEEKLGQRGSPTNELSLNGVRVPRECIIGFRGRGQVNALETLNTGRTGLAVTTRSGIQELLEDGEAFLGGTRDPAYPFPLQQSAATPLQSYWMGRVTEELVATAAIANELIGLFDHPKTKGVRMESAIGKYYGSEAEHDAIDWMERLRGLDGQTHRHRIEKTRRDARILNIYEGTNEVQRFLILRDLAQQILPAWRAARGEAEESGQGDAGSTAAAAYPELGAQLEEAKSRLMSHLDQADSSLGPVVWTNVNLQPCFFRLAEIAGLIKVMDALLYRLEWLAGHGVSGEYGDRLERASVLALKRCLSRIETIDRRYTAAYAYVQDGRYPPDVQLGFLSLDPSGAAAERWGCLPASLQPAAAPRPLDRDVRIAVLVKPVPLAAPRPRLGVDSFEEALYTIDPVDQRGLQLALALKKRDPERVTVATYSLAGPPGADASRQALALGADEAILLEPAASSEADPLVVQDPTVVARAVAACLIDAPADLVVCGEAASDTGQGIVAPALGGILEREHIEGVIGARWADGDDLALRATASGWQGHELSFDLPCVLAVAPAAEHLEQAYGLSDFVRAAAAELTRRPLDPADLGLQPVQVVHSARQGVVRDGAHRIAGTPEEAAAVLLEVAGLTGSAAAAEAEPYRGDAAGYGQQPDDNSPTCLFVCEPVTTNEVAPSTLAALESAAQMAAGLDVALDVVLPARDAEAMAYGVGQAIAGASPRRVYVIQHPGIGGLGWRGHLEWLEELWGMYRGQAKWLLGPAWATTLFARLAADGPPGVARCWPWFNVESVANGGEPVRVGSGILDGAARAVASLPRNGGLRILTFAKTVDVELPGAQDNGTSARESGEAPQVFLYEPRLDYEVESDPVALLLSRLGGGELTLGDAEYIVDFGYGAGGHDGLESLAEPLVKLLKEELALSDSMIGGTRKVTQDLEVLPMDRQIGQTGVRVAPKVLIALAVSGAPQHVDWIGDNTVILSFNLDPDAPLMRLNEQRPAPVVHPIVGDVRETIPRFIEALRASLERADG